MASTALFMIAFLGLADDPPRQNQENDIREVVQVSVLHIDTPNRSS